MPVRAGASHESVCVSQACCVGRERRHLAVPLHYVSCVSLLFEKNSGDHRDDVEVNVLWSKMQRYPGAMRRRLLSLGDSFLFLFFVLHHL